MLGKPPFLYVETAILPVLPLTIEVDGIPVEILEVKDSSLSGGDPYYLAVIRIYYKGIQSRIFTIPAKSERELINKLKIEVTKLKYLEYVYGIEELKGMIT